MARQTAPSLHDRQEALRVALEAARSEVERLEREEQYLAEQVRRAEDQVRYYERLLARHRKDSGPPSHLPRILKRLGKP